MSGSRRGKDVLAETQNVVDSYCKTLDDLLQQYCNCSTEELNVNVYCVLDDVNVDTGPYVGSAGLNIQRNASMEQGNAIGHHQLDRLFRS